MFRKLSINYQRSFVETDLCHFSRALQISSANCNNVTVESRQPYLSSRMTKTGTEIERAYAEKNKNAEDYKRQRAAIDERYREKRKLTETIQERNIRKSKAAIRKQKTN
ncbi:hypothetical protein ANN_19005 [Periplaneta americana]|uniref:Uncharacterized protein n=1 Tax=Periplaneta americana TaxID=6978 RepID=A0ABQ8SQU9_PERAM|nr:hypothetical protein ANN_19005 [Periplaneta americana]